MEHTEGAVVQYHSRSRSGVEAATNLERLIPPRPPQLHLITPRYRACPEVALHLNLVLYLPDVPNAKALDWDGAANRPAAREPKDGGPKKAAAP